MNKRALIAMSGGVDSSVAAYIMKKNGYEIFGITLKLFDGAEDKSEKSCCSIDDITDAGAVAAELGIPHYVLNFKADFRNCVIDRFISAYKNGATPNPCIDCNRYIKFKRLAERAAELDCGYVATGHYARTEKDGGRFLLKKSADMSKDQTYVLYSLTQRQLEHTIFPLGDMTKEEVRSIAEECGFVNAKKRDSQDICFVPDGDYAGFIQSVTGEIPQTGNFVDTAGNVIGTHRGIIHYTIGQRKGLGVSFGKPMYVCGINSRDNTVVLGDNEALFAKTLTAEDINLIAYDRLDKPIKAAARVRYSQKEQPAVIEQTDEGHLHIEFDSPQRAITRGQAVVIYDGDIVIGGGRIM